MDPIIIPTRPEEVVLADVHLLTHILSLSLPGPDLMRLSRVSRTWSAAANTESLWRHIAQAAYGTWPGLGNPDVGTTWKALFRDHATLSALRSLTGWCEDHCTCNGASYRMDLQGIKVSLKANPAMGLSPGMVPTASAIRHRLLEGRTRWSYTLPIPRTRIKIALLPVTPEVWTKGGPARIATTRMQGTTLPLYSRRVIMTEVSKLPGSGPVDVPTQYWGYQVGPALLGCFLPTEAPLYVLQLKSQEQKLGTFILWPKQWQTQPTPTAAPTARESSRDGPGSSNGSSTGDSGAAAVGVGEQLEGVEEDMCRPSPQCTQQCPCAGTPACMTSATEQASRACSGHQAHPSPRSAAGSPRTTQEQARGAGAAGPPRPCCDWLRAQGLTPGNHLSGTVLANFLISSVTEGPRSGNATLGGIQVWVTDTHPAPPDARSHGCPAIRVHLLLHLPSREWVIDGMGVPAPAEPHEASYTAPITCTAAVDVTADGTLHPVALPPLAQAPVAPELRGSSWELPPCSAAAAQQAPGGVRQVAGGERACGDGAGPGAVVGAVGGGMPPWMQRLRLNTALPAADLDMEQTAKMMKMMLAAALQLSNSPSAAHPELVDRWPAQLQGRVAGGVMMAMMTHPVAGRAVFCASTQGLSALCPQFV